MKVKGGLGGSAWQRKLNQQWHISNFSQYCWHWLSQCAAILANTTLDQQKSASMFAKFFALALHVSIVLAIAIPEYWWTNHMRWFQAQLLVYFHCANIACIHISSTHDTHHAQTRHAQSSLRDKGLLYTSDVISLPMWTAIQHVHSVLHDQSAVDARSFIADVAASPNPLQESIADKVCMWRRSWFSWHTH